MVTPAAAASSQEPSPPNPRDLNALIYWAARWRLGGPAYYRGPLMVSVSEGDHGGQTVTLRPRPGDELYGPDGPGAGQGEGRTGLEGKLLAAFLSADARRVMEIVSDGPVSAKIITARSGVERSRCYTLLTDLRDRGLIVDLGDGYEVADSRLWDAVKAVEGKRAG